jgi:hypothetical protein
MIILSYLAWFFIGALMAFAFLLFQNWTVRMISPERRKLSHWLVIGGAVLRWAFICLIFVLALSNSLVALLILFAAFLLTRMVILLRWDQTRFMNHKLTQ